MTIDFVHYFTRKDGSTAWEVASLYTDKNGSEWVITGRWMPDSIPAVGTPVKYVRGQYGYIAFGG